MLAKDNALKLKQKAIDFWESDLEDIEPDDLMSFPTSKLDSRVPHQGTVLLGRTYKSKK